MQKAKNLSIRHELEFRMRKNIEKEIKTSAAWQETKRIPMIVPIAWRSSLALDNGIIEHITLPNMKAGRGILL